MVRSRVLLVEDEFLVRAIIAEAMSDAGLDVIAADSGDAAAALINDSDGIDLLVTDMQMPGTLDGLAVARRARQRHPDVAVIYMTGRPEVLDRLGPLGPHDAVLPKPFGITEVLAVARRLLDRPPDAAGG